MADKAATFNCWIQRKQEYFDKKAKEKKLEEKRKKEKEMEEKEKERNADKVSSNNNESTRKIFQRQSFEFLFTATDIQDVEGEEGPVHSGAEEEST